MATTIIPATFNIRNVSLSVPKAVEIDDKGKKTTVGKKAFVNYNGGKFAMQSAPSMRVPFGVSVFDQSNPPKYSINLSFNGHETNADVKAFYQAIQDLDRFVVDEAVKNSKAWFGKEKSREVLEEFYTPSLKFGKNKDYPPTMKVNLKRRGESFETKFFDSKGKPHRDMPVEELLAKGTQVTVLLTLKDVWIAGTGKFNLRWDADQILINKLADAGSGFGFNMSAIAAGGAGAADEEEAVEQPKPAAAAGGAGKASASHEIEDDEEDFKAPAKTAPSVLDSVMPSAAAEDEEDGEDHEPVPAPKKPVVKKKVVVGKK